MAIAPSKQLRTLGGTIASALGDELTAAQKATLLGKLNASLPADERLMSRAQSEALIGSALAVLNAPTLISFSRVGVPENEPAGFVVGTPSANGTAPVTLTLVDDAGGAFALVGGELRTTAALDYEAGATRTVRLRASNAVATIEADFQIALTDIPAPVAAGALSDRTFAQGAGSASVNAAADFSNTAGASWSVSPAWVSIDPETGVVTIPLGTVRALATVTVDCETPEGAASSAFDVTIEAGATEQITLAQGSVRWTISAANAVQTADGAWIVEGPVTVHDVTPATVGTGAATRHGLMVNPLAKRDPNHAGQAWDGRDGTFNAATAAPAFPFEMNPGDVASKCVSHDDGGPREGYPAEGAALFVVDTLPAGLRYSAAPVSWTGRTGFDFPLVDVAAGRAALPSLATGTHTDRRTWTSLRGRLARFQPFAAYSDETSSAGGSYQAWFLHQTGKDSSPANYSQWLYSTLEPALLGIIGDLWTEADKDEALLWLGSMGVHFAQVGRGLADPFRGEGGHNTFQLPCVACAAVTAPSIAPLTDLNGRMTSNQLQQNFLFTQALLDRLVPHTSNTEPQDFYQRTITAIAGNVVSVDLSLGNGRYRWHSDGKVMTKASGAATDVVAGQGSFIRSDGVQGIEVVDASGFAVGDVIWFRAATPFAVGDPAWLEEGLANFFTFDLSPHSAYFNGNNRHAGLALFLGAAGLASDPGLDAFVQVTEARAAGFRDYSPPFETTWAAEFWAQHHLALLGGADLTIEALPRDRFLYGSGAAIGENQGLVLMEGTGQPGESISIRLLNEDDATHADYPDLVTVGGDGSWSALLAVSRTAFWLRPRVKMGGGGWQAAPGDYRFAAAHLVDAWGQSEFDNAQKSYWSAQPTTPSISDPEAVQMIGRHLPGGTAGILYCADGAEGMTKGLAAWAEQWIALVPGEKVLVTWHTKDGSSWLTALDDDTSAVEGSGYREWSDDLAMFLLATGNRRTTVDLAYASWYATLQGEAATAIDKFLARAFRVDAAGNAADPGTDHDFTELYQGYARTRWYLADPHRFESEAESRELFRQNIRANWNVAGAAGRILAPGVGAINYQNGHDDDLDGVWTDTTHPGRQSDDGMPRLMRFMALQVAAALGRYDLEVPEIDNAAWEAGGAYLEMWSTAGPITTERLARGLPAIDKGAHPWANEVAGPTINGEAAADAVIAAGRIRVTPPSGELFDGADLADFAENGAAANPSGLLSDALGAGWYLNLPVVDVGVPILGRVPILPKPAPAVLANPLAADAPLIAFARGGPEGAEDSRWTTPTNLPAGTTAMTVRLPWRAVFSALGSGGKSLLLMGGNTPLRFYLYPSGGNAGQLYITAKNQALGTVLAAYYDLGALDDADNDLVVAMLMAQGGDPASLVTKRGGELLTPNAGGTYAGADGDTFFQREVGIFSGFTGPVKFGPISIWRSVAATMGDLPAGAPWWTTGTTLAEVNSIANGRANSEAVAL